MPPPSQWIRTKRKQAQRHASHHTPHRPTVNLFLYLLNRSGPLHADHSAPNVLPPFILALWRPAARPDCLRSSHLPPHPLAPCSHILAHCPPVTIPHSHRPTAAPRRPPSTTTCHTGQPVHSHAAPSRHPSEHSQARCRLSAHRIGAPPPQRPVSRCAESACARVCVRAWACACAC